MEVKSGSEINVISEWIVDELGLELVVDENALYDLYEIDRALDYDVIGYSYFSLYSHGVEMEYSGLVVSDEDVGIVAGAPFMELNDIMVRPSRHQVVFSNEEVFVYGNADKDSNRSMLNVMRPYLHQVFPADNGYDISEQADVLFKPVIPTSVDNGEGSIQESFGSNHNHVLDEHRSSDMACMSEAVHKPDIVSRPHSKEYSESISYHDSDRDMPLPDARYVSKNNDSADCLTFTSNRELVTGKDKETENHDRKGDPNPPAKVRENPDVIDVEPPYPQTSTTDVDATQNLPPTLVVDSFVNNFVS